MARGAARVDSSNRLKQKGFAWRRVGIVAWVVASLSQIAHHVEWNARFVTPGEWPGFFIPRRGALVDAGVVSLICLHPAHAIESGAVETMRVRRALPDHREGAVARGIVGAGVSHISRYAVRGRSDWFSAGPARPVDGAVT
jgi:hypothetical protein